MEEQKRFQPDAKIKEFQIAKVKSRNMLKVLLVVGVILTILLLIRLKSTNFSVNTFEFNSKKPPANNGEKLKGFKRHVLPGGRSIFILGAKPTPSPVVIIFHGGGWRNGHPAEQEMIARELVHRGYAVALPDYRLLRGSVTIDDLIKDAGGALNWLQSNAVALNLDINRLFVAGSSAGGHLAYWAVCDAVTNGLSPAAMVLLAPAVDTSFSRAKEILGERADDLSPLNHINAKLPPILIVHARDDEIIPIEGIRRFQAAADSIGVKIELLEVQSGGHGFSVTPAAWIENVQVFLDKHIEK